MSSEARPFAIRADGLGKRYAMGSTSGMFRYRSLREQLTRRARHNADETFWALHPADFEIAEGERVGVIGRNGAGKSTFLKLLAGITPPTQGRIEVRGRVGSLLEVGTGFHPELSGRENIFLAASVLGMRRSEIASKLDDIVAFAGVDRFLDTPVKRYSSGMYLRLAFAVAAHIEPEILLVDEVLAVGDAEFQKKCLGRMAEFGESGRTVVFVSHSMAAVLRLCERAILLDGGRVVADGPASEVIRTYLDSGLGTTAHREWASPQDAPGDAVAALKSVRVVNDGGVSTEEINITRPLTVEVEYWQRSADPALRTSASVGFYNEEGVCLFIASAFSTPEWVGQPTGPGVYKAVCHVPGNFLAEGKVSVTAGVATLQPYVIHVIEHDAVAFQVVDRSDGDGVRGAYANDWPGVVRPLLDWTLECEHAPIGEVSA